MQAPEDMKIIDCLYGGPGTFLRGGRGKFRSVCPYILQVDMLVLQSVRPCSEPLDIARTQG